MNKKEMGERIEEQKKYIGMLEKENEELRESLAAAQNKSENISKKVASKEDTFDEPLDNNWADGLFDGENIKDYYKKECEKIYGCRKEILDDV